MADDKQPRKQAVTPRNRGTAAEGLAQNLAGVDWEAFQANMGRIGEALALGAGLKPGIAEGTGIASAMARAEAEGEAVPHPAAVGGEADASGSRAGGAPIKKIKATKTQNRPGVLRVKEYPITEDTLENIGTLRVSAAFWFAIGSLALGFVLSAWQSLSLGGDEVSETAKATWTTYRNIGGAIALIAYGAGLFYFCKGKSVIKFVKDNTIHDPLD